MPYFPWGEDDDEAPEWPDGTEPEPEDCLTICTTDPDEDGGDGVTPAGAPRRKRTAVKWWS